MNGKTVAIGLLLLGIFAFGHCQPVTSSKRNMGGMEIYQDFGNKDLFYYAPGDLKLALEPDGKPEFQLVEMRYTGSSAYGDQGKNHFMNVVQFTVIMEQATADALRAAREELGDKNVDLRPLPVRSIEAFMVAAVGEGSEKGSYKKIGKDGSFQAEGEKGASGKYGFWTERTFTLKLEDHEAQLLWDQVANGQLSLSLGYTFYADMLPGAKADMKISGDAKLASNFETSNEDLLMVDTLVVMQPVKSDAFAVSIDVARWPGVLKKIDLNEGIPPAYAVLEVRCFDFADGLRPDLAVKGIDVAAMGVGGQMITIPTQKFLAAEPDLYARQIRFPYAVKLTMPYRYRVVEYTTDGDKVLSAWKVADSWGSHLDITTPARQNAILKKEIDIEIPVVEFPEKGITKVDVHINYTLGGRPFNTVVSYLPDEALPLKQATFKCDRDEGVTYDVTWTFTDDTIIKTEGDGIPADNYLYIIVPER